MGHRRGRTWWRRPQRENCSCGCGGPERALAIHLGQLDQDGVVMTRPRLEALDRLAGRRGRFQAQIGMEGAEFAPKNVALAKVRRDVENVHVS